jgi:RNA polymerase sigma-70 factor, ECF subfamily
MWRGFTKVIMEDNIALSRLKKGDHSGLEELVTRYQVQAIHIAQLIVRDRFLAEEVVQSSFVLTAERIVQFDMDRPFTPWFFRIVINEALKVAKRQKRFVPLNDEPEDDAVLLARWLVDPHPQPEKILEAKETRQIIRSALERLAPEQRAVVVMRYFLEMSEAEMSANLGRPTSTIKWYLRAARERLRNLLRSPNL